MSRVLAESGPDQGLAWHYGNPLVEQRTLAEGQASVDLGNRELIRVAGSERKTWLHSLSTGSFEDCQTGETVRALFLDANGRIQFGLQGVDDGEAFWGWTEPGQADGLLEFFQKMKFWTDVTFSKIDDHRLYWVGSEIAASGIEIDYQIPMGRLVIADTEPAEITAGTWAFDALRINAGIPRIGFDTDQKTIPNEIGLYATTLDKGCYPGQETVARVYNVGRPPRRLVRLLLDGSEERLPKLGADLVGEDRVIGVVGTSAIHFEEGPIGLGLVKCKTATDLTLLADGIPANQEILVEPDVGLHVRMGQGPAN